jgi:hypothetical protein
MDRKALRSFNADAIKALEGIAAEHGLSIRPGRHSFNDANANLKFTLSDITSSGEVLTPEAEAFKLQAARFGLSPDDLYGTFTFQGEQFRITGLKTRRPKFPISAEKVSTGRAHKFTESSLRNATITQKGVGRRAAIAAQKGELTADVKREFASLASQLSPENLSWDGERSATEQNKAAARLNKRWNELEKQIGRQVTESEAFGFHN